MVDLGKNINFGHIVNGNVMAFSTDFGNSGWRPTGPGPGKGFHKWYDLVDISNNSNGFRCDEFIDHKDRNELHVLFAGCSVTWGDALNLEDLWSYKVYKKISEKHKATGFFSIAFPGTSIIQEIFWIIKYCIKYGNPNHIFFLMPNMGRFVNVGNIGNSPEPTLGSSLMETDSNKPDEESMLLASYLTFEAYMMLEQYCKTNNINLISSSWSFGDSKNSNNKYLTSTVFKNFETFFSLDDDGINQLEWKYEYVKNNPGATLKALDDIHPGTAEHAYFTNRMLDRYMKVTNEDIRL
jgi:hypothetical protein